MAHIANQKSPLRGARDLLSRARELIRDAAGVTQDSGQTEAVEAIQRFEQASKDAIATVSDLIARPRGHNHG
jgi:hypothetical protein